MADNNKSTPAADGGPGIAERPIADVLTDLVWSGPAHEGQLRFYEADGKAISLEEIAKRPAPAEVPKMTPPNFTGADKYPS
jgi:hypothetical protein